MGVMRITVYVAFGSLGVIMTSGQDEYMTCSRPVKQSRSMRQLQSPCDTMKHNGDSWCTLPGPMYPWHSVRRFVFENQGLMRRMYGEVRQLSLLRMEFSGDSNALEESRDLDDLEMPIPMLVTDPTLTLNQATTETIPTLVITSASAAENTMEEQPIESDLARSSQVTEENDNDSLLTTIPDLVTTTEAVPAETVMADVLTEDSVPTTLPTPVDTIPPPLPELIPSSLPSPNSSSTAPPPTTVDLEKTRNDDVLFPDAEKTTTTSTSTTTEEPRVRTTNRQGVNACPVKEEVVAPYWANNTRGEVLALLNLYPFEQYIHWEKCTNEHRQMYCRDGCKCEQQYRLHRLLAFDPQNECRGIFSDWFRFPSCCVCKCYFDEEPERISFNRSPRLFETVPSILDNLDLDRPDVHGVDDSHFFYKYPDTTNMFRQPRRK